MNDTMNSVRYHIDRLNLDARLDLKTETLYGPLYRDFLADFDTVECLYNDENSLKRLINKYSNKAISTCSINCQSILAKYHNLSFFIDKLNSDKSKLSVAFLQETWNAQNITFNGYEYIQADREGRGGGVALLIHNSIQSEKLNDSRFFRSNVLECVSSKINFNNNDLIVCSFYRPPNNDNNAIEEFLNIFNEYLDYLASFNIPVIFGTDININLFDLANLNSKATTLFETLTYQGFVNPITKATRISNNSSSLIDLICNKDLTGNLVENGIVTSDISDHLIPYNLFLLNSNNRPRMPEFINKRTFSNQNLDRFKVSLAIQDWRSVKNIRNDVNLAYDTFFGIFINLFNENIPKKKTRLGKKHTPTQEFMTDVLLEMRDEKIKLYNIYLSNKTPETRQAYNLFRNNFNKRVRQQRKTFFNEKVRAAGTDSKKLWDVLKSSMGLKKKDTKVDFLEVDGNRIYGNQQIADQMNKSFSNIGPSLTPLIPSTNKHFSEFLGPRCNNNFFLGPVSEKLVLDTISCLKNKRSEDVNELSVYLINYVKECIINPLTHIINLSFELGKMPENMKCSKTISIYKNGPSYLVDNFRGVSIINTFSKIKEKLVYNRLLTFLEDNQFFDCKQYGFRSGRSTVQAVMELTNRISKALASGRMALAILLDVRKCFDMLSREVLLAKLNHFGVRGRALNWFASYFSNRCQKVFFNGVSSTKIEDILWGVLQGSILGVLLFLIYINDLSNCCEELMMFLFADDGVGFLEHENLDNLIIMLNRELPKLVEWYSANKLLLHPSKTKIMIFNSPRHVISAHEADLRANFPVFINLNNVNENDLSKITQLKALPSNDEKDVRHLGIMLDCNLTFKYHLKKVHARISKVIFSLKQMKNLLNRRHLTLLYSAYVKSILDYGAPLFVGAYENAIKPIITLQKHAVRIISGANRLDHTFNLFKNLEILRFDKLIKYHASIFMFDYKNGLLPENFNNTWKTNFDINGRDLRNREDYYIRPLNREFLKRLPLFKLPDIWNTLNQDIKNIDNRKVFCNSLKERLLNSE